ncbi:hypothetical protein AMS68_004329 [Peltaster fructicola]|uniref:DNA polymerase n=1 Tax=Peltaster fructicola TaxID=286661 RepID=A0A6H0XVL9_9PEZI|nr:hypothetical protein AMS68_004329 [Peltaster fructicola]
MAKDVEVFRVRLNCVDHYQGNPGPLDPPIWGARSLSATQRPELPSVPIIRVFGSTQTGQKVCAHIHGAFPYLFIPYTESLETEHLEHYISQLRQAIDHALALSYRRNPYDNPRSSTFVAYISLVKGVPFFGYNVGYRYYLKIYLLNPLHMTRFADLLQQGAILKRAFQPYEAHLQYLLQWMCDFNLFGCAYIETNKPKFRLPLPVCDDLETPSHLWHDHSVREDQTLSETLFPRQSHCQIELDIRVEDILNRLEITQRSLHHNFVERLSQLDDLPAAEKWVHSMAGLWKDETKRRKRRMGLADTSSSPFPPEVLVSMSADPRNDSKGGWIHEDEFREMVEELAKQEKQMRGGDDITFDSFVAQATDDDNVQTIFASVGELFQDKLMEAFTTADPADDTGLYGTQAPKVKLEADQLVDIGRITQVVNDQEAGEIDEEAVRIRAIVQRKKLRAQEAKEIAKLQNGLGETDEAQSSDASAHNTPRKRRNDGAVQSTPKRFRFADETSPSPTKRVAFKVQDITSNTSAPLRKEAHVVEELNMPPSGQPPQPSQHSSQASQNGRLNFVLVKNPHDPATIARLSQQNGSKKSGQKDKLSEQESDMSLQVPSKSSNTSADTTGTKSTDPKRLQVPTALIKNYARAFKPPHDANVFLFGDAPPTLEVVQTTVSPSVIYQDAYYSDETDVPERPREYAGQEFRLESTTLPYLPNFDQHGGQEVRKIVQPDRATQDLLDQRRQRQCSLIHWEIMKPPPTWNDVNAWLAQEHKTQQDDLENFDVEGAAPSSQFKRKRRPNEELSQIEGPTQKHKHGFKYSQRKASTSVQHETGYMSTMSLEVHVNSRADLAPDPERDEVNMVVWCIRDEQMEGDGQVGAVVLSDSDDPQLFDRVKHAIGPHVQVEQEDNELDLINHMVDTVRAYDPDVLTGYEVHNGSWGYLIERARLHYEFDLPNEFSRMKSQSHGRFGKDADRWGFNQTSTVRITGRHTINIWRAMRSELNLLQYTMENVVFHLLHKRIPHYAFSTLTKWYRSKKPRDLTKVLDYFVSRTQLDLEILDANELIPRTSEQARLLGVDFFSVFSRGSQFKVESLMFRIAKPESFVLVSPSRKQVGAQNALECLPLVMEPQSAFYNSPLLVLDFQSLYPSVMIAYNYCYSTCLGRITNWRGTNKMGFADFKRTPGLLELVKDKLNLAPNGMMYVKPEMRKSLLAKMLGEILETRVMVKSGMKVDKDDKTLQQLLNNRQLALKLIANVTYGYTSASFSGRMPCSEIADSIVQTGRETLEKTIAFIHSVEKWGAEVVYGDTDSLFVYLKGRSRDEAFKIGDEIAKEVTNMNPRPIKLKFEKVYHPCVLLAKKRYVGYKYESPKQKVPDFDAKGIETVRRDGTPAEQKIEEKALKLLFRTSDLSEVKDYFQKQCAKIMAGRFSVQDFCFAKEVKLGTYADKGPPPPGALIATKRMLRDPRLEPQYGERVPYIVIAGAPGARLFERCVEPERLLYDEHAELDAEYYISKNIIPPLERIFNLVGANVRQWFDEMPKVQRIRLLGGPKEGEIVKGKKTMESFMGSSLCIVCRDKLPPVRPQADVLPLPLCATCRYEHTQQSLLELQKKMQTVEKRASDLRTVCRSCADLAFGDEVKCDSRDCPVFYTRIKAETHLNVAQSGIRRVLQELEQEANLDALVW